MPTQATVLLTWSAIYAFSGLLYVATFTRRGVEPELSRFGYVCVTFAILSFARMLDLVGSDPDEHLRAGQLSAMGRYLLGAAFVALCASIARAPSRLVPMATVWAGVGLVLVVARIHGDLAPDRDDYETSPAGMAMFVVGLLLATAALLDAIRHRGYDPYVRRVVGAATVSLVAALADALLTIAQVRPFDVLAHAGIVGTAMVHWTLLDRFGEATERLASRRAAYAESLEALSAKHDELLETEQLAAVGELSAVIAHEVRNPLAIIRNATSAMRKASYGPDAEAKLLDILDEETDRLQKLTFELGAFAEHAKPSVTECSIESLFERCVHVARVRAPEGAPRDVRFEAFADVDTIPADRDLLDRALFYLVQNAMDASEPGGTIRLEAREVRLDDRSAVEIAVTDEGEGMSAETLEKATTPFFTTRSRGTGLALAIAARIATNHGGRLTIESKPSEGTTARIALPRERPSLLPPLTDLPGPAASDAPTLR